MYKVVMRRKLIKYLNTKAKYFNEPCTNMVNSLKFFIMLHYVEGTLDDCGWWFYCSGFAALSFVKMCFRLYPNMM